MISLNELIEILRGLGFKISVSEIIEINSILSKIDSENELKLCIQMIVCKSKKEQELFQLVWKSLFDLNEKNPDHSKLSMDINPSTLSSDNSNSLNGMFGQGIGGQSGIGLNEDVTIKLSQFSSNYKSVVRQLLQGNTRNAASILLRKILMQIQTPRGFELEKEKALEEIKLMMLNFPSELNLLELLEEEFNQLIVETLEEPMRFGVNPLLIQDIESLPLISLNSTPELNNALKKISKKFASKYKRKYQQGKNKINLRKTIRKNIQHGGHLISLINQKRRVDKTKLVIITDISDSALHATRIFLNIIWNAKDVFSNIQFYEFIGSCINVTNDYRKANSVNDGVDKAIKTWEKYVIGKENSDYYRAFKNFQKLIGNKIDARTVIFILGDLRDWLGPWKNDIPLSSVILGDLNKKVKKLVVLNPEPKNLWNTGDSICSYCEEQQVEIYEITSLSKLTKVLMEI